MLDGPQNRIQNQDRDDDQHGLDVPCKSGNQCRNNQNKNHQIRKLFQKDPQGRLLFRFYKGIRAILTQPLCRLFLTQSLRAALQQALCLCAIPLIPGHVYLFSHIFKLNLF